MPRKDLHEKAFDETTLTKLEIFERYLEAWLPVFLNSQFKGSLQVWDFFAGQGYDVNGQRGSPIKIMDVLKKYQAGILKSGKRIRIVLNESSNEKCQLLEDAIREYQKGIASITHLVNVELFNNEFQKLYKDQYANLKKGNNLIFLDQNGVKEITEEIFCDLASFPRTDFLFFISSSYFNRFAPDFQKIHPKLDIDEIRKSQYTKLHIAVLNLYKTYLKSAKIEAFLFPFSLMKRTPNSFNIYGLIFCAKHILAAQKFLTIAWDQNNLNGQANYDIENDMSTPQMDLFTGNRALTKIEKFQNCFENEILSGRIKTNREAYIYVLTEGHISQHVEQVMKSLKDSGRVHYTGHSGITYNSYKDNKIVEFKIRKQ